MICNIHRSNLYDNYLHVIKKHKHKCCIQKVLNLLVKINKGILMVFARYVPFEEKILLADQVLCKLRLQRFVRTKPLKFLILLLKRKRGNSTGKANKLNYREQISS